MQLKDLLPQQVSKVSQKTNQIREISLNYEIIIKNKTINEYHLKSIFASS